jgi:hypothetical protein
MSETTTTDTCSLCGHTSEYREFVWNSSQTASVCEDSSACTRRCKRNVILAEMQEMAKRPHVHPVDKITRTGVALCGFFMGLIVAMGLAYLWFGI